MKEEVTIEGLLISLGLHVGSAFSQILTLLSTRLYIVDLCGNTKSKISTSTNTGTVKLFFDMKSISILVFLTTVITTLADPVCIEAILSTIAYIPALTTHNGACPTATPGAYDLAPNKAGCCQSDLRIKTVGIKGAACCPCGAFCTGFFPQMAEWTENAAGALFIASPTTANPTLITTTAVATTGTSSNGQSLSGETTTITPMSTANISVATSNAMNATAGNTGGAASLGREGGMVWAGAWWLFGLMGVWL